ncbi:TonB-dependent receptor [Arsukibacterium indicum]|uniref:TonB-dependent receptor n=1 Tax=Arsukibacterium indicum TaxID=2848612 RepID=A0ABS6MRG6_9GAMM|nr:TonB-dependent receptor [Arsukibacterium indicum]MBV2130862.1 TonB-dependent receptor [Arsukibacterium indicum]
MLAVKRKTGFNKKPIVNSLLVALTLPVAAYVQAAAVVEGVVQKANSGNVLSGALVKVADSQQQVFTDASGRFVLRNLNPGTVTLEISYIGLPAQRQQIELSENSTQAVVIELADVERLAVVGQRQAQNKALNMYRASDAITNYIAADDMGQFVDQNVAESLQRLPGTSISRDQGEGRFVSIRGIAAGLSSVTVNGMRIGTPEGSSRAVPLDVIPTGSIEGISVTKAPTPDMPGDAIGGSVDVKSASAFDREGRQIRYRAEASFNELSGETSPKLSLNASDTFSLNGDNNKNFGVAVGLNYLDRKLESDNVEAEYDMVDFQDGEVFSLIELQQRKYYVNRERIGANLNLEYRPDSSNKYFANTVFSRFSDAETRQRSIFVFEDGTLSDFDGNNAYVTEMEPDAFRRRIRFRTKEQDTLALNLGAEHSRSSYNLDYYAGVSATRERVLDENEGRFEYTGDPLDATYVIGQGIPGFGIFSNGVANTSHLDNANYELDRAVLEPKVIDDDEYNLGANFELPYAFGNNNLTLKTGIDLRWKQKDTNIDIIELRRTPDAMLDQFTIGAPSYGLGNLGQGISSAGYINFFNQNRADFTARPQDIAENTQLSLVEDFVADEDVQAGYLMATYDGERSRLIAGVRVERTDYSASGNQLTFDEDGELTVSQRSVSNNYTNVLPGLHYSYELADDLMLRAAWTNTIARPSFNDISPRAEINLEDNEVELGNPDLDPYEATNYDLLLDWYYNEGSLLSAGIFYKDIDNFIVELTSNDVPEFAGFDVTRPVNALSAIVSGLEFAWQHSFVQPQLTGILVGANFTLLDTDLAVLERPGESFSLPESAEQAGNFYLGYEDKKFSTRLSVSYRDKFLSEVGDDVNYDIYVAAHTQVDVTASYKLSKQVELVAELINLTDEPLELYQGNAAYTYQFEEYGMTFALGIKGRF